MKKSIYLSILLSIYLSISLNGQVINNPEIEEKTGIKRNVLYNLEEIKVRWKKAALENCPGGPCPFFSEPGPCSSIVATPTGPYSASISFISPTTDGGSPITGYIVTATSTPSAPAKRKLSAIIIVSGTSSPIVVTGLTFGVNYIFSVVATNAVGPSPAVTTPTTVTPCVLNTVSAGSSTPTLAVNVALTNITHTTTIATGIGTVTGLPAGVTTSWSANVITISGTPTATGSFSYIILLTGGCGIVNATGSITVSASSACAAAAASTTPTLTVNTVLTNITHATTSATGIGTASGLPTGVTAAWSSNTITISGTPSTTGTFNYTIPLTGTSCSAVNATGTITVSAATVPGAPTSVVATAGNASASVAFVAPSSNGGSVITGYTVTSSPAGGIATGASSPLTVTGLTNGTAYTFTVVATNAVGSSAASAASSAVTPAPAATVPGAPTSVAATAGNATASVAFVVPSSNGGSVITGYTVTSSPAGGIATGASSPLTVTGLTNGTAYTFTVVATNAVGSSAASAASSAVTPATVPGAPTSVIATAGNTTASVAFVAPASTGGSVITGYTVTSNPAGGTATGSSSPLTVTGLTNGTAYTFTVVATNALGSSAASAASSAVTPARVPGAPKSVVATAGNTTASVAFVAPASTGGSVITGYTVTSNPAGGTATGSSSPLTVTGLTNGTTYTFTVVATNGVGNSVASAASSAVTLCPTSTITDIDNNVYNTVSIGTQCWTKTNLRVRKYNDGTEIRFDASGGSGGNTSQTWSGMGREYGAYTIYAHDSTATPSNLTSYGYLYNWYAVKGIASIGSTTYKNICPSGWHVPTDSDWNKLVRFIHSGSPAADTSSTSQKQSTTAGTKLKETGTTYWSSESSGTDNSSGFSGLPGGVRDNNGSFSNIRNEAFFWSATEYSSSNAWFRNLNASNGDVYRFFYYNKTFGASVRCLRD